MVYWATVASGFDSTTIASSNSFKSIEDLPLILKGRERGLKILKVSISWLLCWQLHFMKCLFYPPGIFFLIIPFCAKKIRLEMELELADQEEHWSSFKKVQGWMKMSCHGFMSSSHQTLAGPDSENSWSFLSTQLTGGPQLWIKGMWPKQEGQLPPSAVQDPPWQFHLYHWHSARIPQPSRNPCSAQNSNKKV